MSIITDYLLQTLRDCLNRHHVALWYDPRGEYAEFAARLSAADLGLAPGGAPATLARYDPDRGFLALRHDLEPVWRADEPPRLLIYVPQARPPSPGERPLIEFETAGAVLQPGMQPPQWDTALAAVARRALAGKLPAAQIARLADQLEAEPAQLTLSELEAMIDRGRADAAGVLSHLYPDARHPAEIVLHFLADPSQDAELSKREAVGQVASLLSASLGAPLAGREPATLREAAARRVLLTDLMLALGPDAPPLLALAEQPAARQAAADLARDWRTRQPLAAAYEQAARQVEAAAGMAGRLAEGAFSVATLARAETFAAVELALLAAVEEALLRQPSVELIELAVARRDGFWAQRSTELRGRWNAVLSAGRLLWQAEQVAAGLRPKALSARALWDAYTHGRGGNAPWCLLDRYQRQFERDFHAVDLDESRHDALQRLAARARAVYAETAGALAERFVRAYEADQFELPGQTQQADIYRAHVYPEAQNGRVAYFLIDALRYEMAHELVERLAGDRRVQLAAAVATPPTITEVGMAALMPGAEKGVVLAADKDKLRIIVGGKTLATRQDRLEHFNRAVGGDSVAVRLQQLVPLSDGKLRAQLRAAPVILVTATEEIDGRFETAPALARKELDEVFDSVRRALGTLFRLGVRAAVLTADHGYLFGEALTAAQVMERPNGQAVVEKRRVWVGRGGQTVPGTLRTPLSAFGIAGEAGDLLELVTPYNLAVFKAAGPNLEYFHGGLSLPELAIPVLTVGAGAGDAPAETGHFRWTLRLGSKTISSQVLTVTIEGQTQELFASAPPRVTLEVRTASGAVSALIGATDGYLAQTNDIQLALDPDNPRQIAPNTAILQIPQPPSEQVAGIVLLDSTTGATLAQLNNVAITITI